MPSPGCSPDCPGRSSAGRGQQLGGRRQPRAARRGPALGDTRFECGARDSQSSLPVPVPEAIANRELSCGEWVCAGVSTKGPAPLPQEESGVRPWVSERKGNTKSGRPWDVGGRGSPCPLLRRSSILRGVPSAPRQSPSTSWAALADSSSPAHCAASAPGRSGPPPAPYR